jgi:hypothetical protein
MKLYIYQALGALVGVLILWGLLCSIANDLGVLK